MDQIIEYYKLCSVVPKSEQLVPLVNHIERDIVNVIFTKKHVEGFLDDRDGTYHLREDVIGAAESKGSGKSVIIVI